MTWIPAGPALLFAPADRPERFAKAAERSDMVILDLEDGCRSENRPEARENVKACELDPARTIVRINPPGTPDFDLDVAAVVASPFTQVMVPKSEDLSIFDASSAETGDWQIIALIETPKGVLRLEDVANHPQVVASPFTQVMVPKSEDLSQFDASSAETGDWQIIALIETPKGLLRLEDVANHPQVVALFWGAEDLTAALGGTSSRYGVDELPTSGGGVSGQPGGYREVPRLTRAQVLLHAAAAEKVALDSIHADTADVEGAKAEAVDAAASGFAATVSIHPGLVPAIREAYSPTEEQLTWAKKVVEGAAENSGAFAVDGQMIDAPLLRQAEVILARSGGHNA